MTWAGYRNQIQRWRMLGLGINPLGEFLPTDIPGLDLWLDFSDISTLFISAGVPVTADGDVIGIAEDKSAQSNDAIQGTTANKALYKAGIQNGLSIARFDGVNDFLGLTTKLGFGAGDISVFIVFLTTQNVLGRMFGNFNGIQTFWGVQMVAGGFVNSFYRDAGSDNIDITSTDIAKDGNVHLLENIKDGTTITQFVDSADEQSVTNALLGTVDNNQIERVGYAVNNTGPYAGDIGEIIVYDTPLSTLDRMLVETFFTKKWAIT